MGVKRSFATGIILSYFEKNKNLNTDFIGKMLKYIQINKKR